MSTHVPTPPPDAAEVKKVITSPEYDSKYGELSKDTDTHGMLVSANGKEEYTATIAAYAGCDSKTVAEVENARKKYVQKVAENAVNSAAIYFASNPTLATIECHDPFSSLPGKKSGVVTTVYRDKERSVPGSSDTVHGPYVAVKVTDPTGKVPDSAMKKLVEQLSAM